MVEEWNFLPFCKHPLLMANSQVKPENRTEKRKGTKKNKTTGTNHDHHGRGCHHIQTMAATTALGGAHGQAVVVVVCPGCGFPGLLHSGASF